MQQVFISYKRQYLEFARRVCDRLKTWGHQTWLDVDNVAIDTDDALRARATDNALLHSNVVIGILTPDALHSHEVEAQWRYGFNHLRLILLKHKPYDTSQLREDLKSVQHIDFTFDEEDGFLILEGGLNPASKVQSLVARSEYNISDLPPVPPIDTFKDFLKSLRPTPPPPPSERATMLKKIHQIWIKDVFEKLYYDNVIERHTKESPSFLLHYRTHVIQTNAEPTQIFEDMHRKMLILGEPGVGKTFRLLQILKHLLDKAVNDDNEPIPVVLNLASWSQRQKPIENWLIDELNIQYQVPVRTGQNWRDHGQLLLLLDGLDEVKLVSQDACIIALNKFIKLYRIDLIVCCRTKDYSLLTKQLNLARAIELQPLTHRQIMSYIQNVPELQRLLESDPLSYIMAQAPFFLNTLYYLYKGGSVPMLAGQPDETQWIEHVFTLYVRKRLNEQPDVRYPPNLANKYLVWLATRMKMAGLSEFFIESFQPDWLDTPDQQLRYQLRVALVWAVAGFFMWLASYLVAMAVYFVFAMYVNFWLELFWTSIFALAIGLVFGLIVFLYVRLRKRIDIIDTYQVSVRSLIVNFPRNLLSGFIIGLACGLIVGILMALTIGLLPGIQFGVGTGAIIGAGVASAWIIGGGLVPIPLNVHTEPNEGIHRSTRNALQAAVLYGVSLGIVGGIVSRIAFTILSRIGAWGLPAWLIWGVLIGLGGGILFGLLTKGGLAVIQHRILSDIFVRNGHLPQSYTDFLDYMAKCILIRKVGSGYTFVHRSLRDYFAE